MKYLSYCVALAAALAATISTAQVIYNSSSTAAEGYQRGMGAVISAQGERNLNNSQAAINLTDARSAQIDNQVKSVNAYWEKKDIYSQHQAAENAITAQRREQYIQSRGSLDLSSEDFDRTTGTINWPTILKQPVYDQYRNTLDEMFHKRSYEGALTSADYMSATTALNDWRAAIMQQKGQYPSPVLQQMLRFQIKVKRELDDNLS
jgi:hypothetical protein